MAGVGCGHRHEHEATVSRAQPHSRGVTDAGPPASVRVRFTSCVCNGSVEGFVTMFSYSACFVCPRWAVTNRQRLLDLNSSLEFKLHRLYFISLLNGGVENQLEALHYARHFQPFAAQHQRGETQRNKHYSSTSQLQTAKIKKKNLHLKIFIYILLGCSGLNTKPVIDVLLLAF